MRPCPSRAPWIRLPGDVCGGAYTASAPTLSATSADPDPSELPDRGFAHRLVASGRDKEQLRGHERVVERVVRLLHRDTGPHRRGLERVEAGGPLRVGHIGPFECHQQRPDVDRSSAPRPVAATEDAPEE